ERPARYIERAFAAHGLAPASHEFVSAGRPVRTVEVNPPATTVVVGAHYDTVPGSPGADDNASAVAALIELAGLLGKDGLPIRFVAFANEEEPHFMGPDMGSWVSAKRSRERGEQLAAMLSLEMLGYYSDRPGSQRYPPPLGLFYPDRADYIAFVGDIRVARLVRRCFSKFKKSSSFPAEWLAAPAFVPGITRSDHWSFRNLGFPAIMVTDTAYNRNPNYHKASDTPDTLDYARMAQVTLGLAAMLKDLARENPHR
ncbi:MAG TPA: M28 family peptidase, partial [Burkholderiales bacterium]